MLSLCFVFSWHFVVTVDDFEHSIVFAFAADRPVFCASASAVGLFLYLATPQTLPTYTFNADVFFHVLLPPIVCVIACSLLLCYFELLNGSFRALFVLCALF